MSAHYEVVGVTSYDSKHFHELEEREGVKMVAIRMARPIALFTDLAALWKLYRLMKELTPTIVHTQTPKAGLLGMLASWLADVPVRVHTVGGLPLVGTRGLKRFVLKMAERITYACAHRVLSNSKGLITVIEKAGIGNPGKLRLTAFGSSNGVDTDYFKPDYDAESKDDLRGRYNLKPDDIVFLYIGRLALEKGIVELLEAFVEVCAVSAGTFKLILIGTFEKHYGMLPREVERFVSANPDILPLGRFDDVRPFYKMSDINILPSYREGFPNTVLEASAMQLPSIVTDINGCNEIVENRVNGILIPPRDSAALRDAMLELMSNSEQRKVFGSKSRQKVLEKYKREIVCKAIAEEYQELLSKPIGQ